MIAVPSMCMAFYSCAYIALPYCIATVYVRMEKVLRAVGRNPATNPGSGSLKATLPIERKVL